MGLLKNRQSFRRRQESRGCLISWAAETAERGQVIPPYQRGKINVLLKHLAKSNLWDNLWTLAGALKIDG
jgi:hypothetical protein